jgi:hypothetical protein
MSETKSSLPLWTQTKLPNLPKCCLTGTVQMHAAANNQLLVISHDETSLNVFFLDPITGHTQQEDGLPVEVDFVLSLSKNRFLFIKHHNEESNSMSEFIMWNALTKVRTSFVGDMPQGGRLNYDVRGESLFLMFSFTVGGSDGGFEWSSDTAFSAVINLRDGLFEIPFHEVEDLDVGMMTMLDSNLSFIHAYGRTRGYFHLRDMRSVSVQKNGAEGLSFEPDLKPNYRYKYSFAGRDSEGGVILLGEHYTDHENALFRWHLSNPKFEEVGHWPNFDGYYSETIVKDDGALLIVCSERKNANKIVRQYVPGQPAIDIAHIEDVYSIRSIVFGTDGNLFLYGKRTALKDGKWLVAGKMQFSKLEIE